jgi:hypothetical protein
MSASMGTPGADPDPVVEQLFEEERMPNLANYPVRGKGALRLICPVGGLSGITDAWLSAASAGPDNSTGQVTWWAQTDEGGLPGGEGSWTITFTNGDSTRGVVALPKGTHHVNVHYDFSAATDGGVIALETRP